MLIIQCSCSTLISGLPMANKKSTWFVTRRPHHRYPGPTQFPTAKLLVPTQRSPIHSNHQMAPIVQMMPANLPTMADQVPTTNQAMLKHHRRIRRLDLSMVNNTTSPHISLKVMHHSSITQAMPNIKGTPANHTGTMDLTSTEMSMTSEWRAHHLWETVNTPMKQTFACHSLQMPLQECSLVT